MGSSFWILVHQVIRRADLLLEVVDARMIEWTRNTEVERRIKQNNKHFIIVINKCDMVDAAFLEKEKKRLQKEGYETVFVSSRKHFGSTILKKKLLRYTKDRETYVGVLGYPNSGKSSVINMLKGIRAAPTSSVSNYTRSIRNVRIAENLMLIDTPGVFPFEGNSEEHLALICARSSAQVKDPELAALRVLEFLRPLIPDQIKERYHLDEIPDDVEELLSKIALKRNKLLKKGEPDTVGMSRVIIDDWQQGRLSLEGDIASENINDELE